MAIYIAKLYVQVHMPPEYIEFVVEVVLKTKSYNYYYKNGTTPPLSYRHCSELSD